MQSMTGHQSVGTATISTSGFIAITPALSNTVFKNLCVTIQPLEATAEYTVEVYLAGELSETHTYPDANDKIIAHMMYPDALFPANVGTNAIPRYFEASRENPIGLPVSIIIRNNSSETKTFRIYSTYEAFANCEFHTLAKVRDV